LVLLRDLKNLAIIYNNLFSFVSQYNLHHFVENTIFKGKIWRFMEKKIKISAKFDMQQFDREMRQMKDKLKEMYEPSSIARMRSESARRMEQQGISPTGTAGHAQQAYQQAAKQDARELDNFIKNQVQQQQRLDQALANRTNKLKDLKSQYQEIVKLGQQDLKLKEEIARTESSADRLRTVRRTREEAVSQALDAREQLAAQRPGGMERLGTAYRQGGFSGMGRAGGRMLRQMPLSTMVGAAGAVLGGIATAGAMADPIIGQEIAAERTTRGRMGQAITGAGTMAMGMMQGQGTEQMFYAPQTMIAMNRAMREMEQTRAQDAMRMGARGAGILGGAAGGAVTVGALGSFIPGLGTAVGAGVGGLIGGGIGAYNFIADERMRTRAMSSMPNWMPEGWRGQDFQQRYESMLTQDMVSNFQQSREAEIQMDPMRRLAIQQHQQRTGSRLQTQRLLGIDDDQLFGQGGYIRGGLEAGFTEDMTMQMSQQIGAAGGSTRMARDPVMAMQMARQLNMTNAGQVMGRLSGVMGGQEETEQGTLRILAEGVKRGLDFSEFAGEQRRFTETVANIAYSAGATTPEGLASIAGGFGQFLEDRTTRGIEAAQGAYGTMQQITGQAGGFRGAVQAAMIMEDPELSQLDFDSRMSLAQMSEEQIRAGGSAIRHMATQSGLTLEEFQERALGMKRDMIATRGGTQESIEQLRAAPLGAMTQDQVDTLRGQVATGLMAEDATFARMKTPEQEAFLTALQRGETATPEEFMKTIGERITEDPTRLGDIEVAGRARGEELALDQFERFRGEIEHAAQSMANMNEMTLLLVNGLQQMAETLGENGEVTEATNQFAKTMREAVNRLQQDRTTRLVDDIFGGEQPTGGR
jgi:hypothetical protein